MKGDRDRVAECTSSNFDGMLRFLLRLIFEVYFID